MVNLRINNNHTFLMRHRLPTLSLNAPHTQQLDTANCCANAIMSSANCTHSIYMQKVAQVWSAALMWIYVAYVHKQTAYNLKMG